MMDKPPASENNDDDASTEESTRVESGNEVGREEENMMGGNNTEIGNDGSIRPEDMTIDVGSSKGMSSTSTLGPACDDVTKSGGLLSVIQKSKLMNWAEDNFLREYKILTFEETAKKTEVHEEICNAIGIEKTNWAIVGLEIIKRLRSAMSDRVSLHQKVVKGLYNGECNSKFHIVELYIKLIKVAFEI
jgi:hypothetical protein